ncbi:MAG TPA: hypothetical protein VI565_04745 [Burkholderiales bacterium]|nr:hypothetical protein [Burkholderiales bacterium]
MQARNSARRLMMLVVIAAASRAVAAPPDLSGFWTVKLERTRSGQALIDELPEKALLINDTGAGELAAGDFGGLRLKPAAIEEVRNYDYTQELKRENTCVAPSVAFYMQAPFPMEIYHGSDMIVFKMEYFDLFRVVFLDGREHPPATAPHSKSGHSVGRWEGDTLVVDTTHISRGTFMNNGFNHSDRIHLVERFRLSPDASTLWLTQLYEDPDVFDGLAARYVAWTRVPGEYVYPYECDASYGN